jgi:diguanylate cyclase (GGDEF)-like protein/PAS domain S-box-containing protein
MKLNRRLDLLAMLLGCGAAAIGGIGVVAYALGLPVWLRPSPEATPIVLGAALALQVVGAAIMVTALPPTRVTGHVAGILGGAVAAIGIIALAQHAFALDLGLDAVALHAALGQGGEHPGRIVPAMAVCLVVLGAGVVALQFVQSRRAAIVMVIGATVVGAFGAIALAGYLLDVEFMLGWLGDAPVPPLASTGLALSGAGLCSAVVHHAKLSAVGVDQGRSIVLTAVWMLSVIAIVAGISTFALAQYEYQDVVRADLLRTLRERRAFLEYAILEHVQQVRLGARPSFAASHNDRDGRQAANRSSESRLQEAADVLRDSGFSGWRFRIGDATVASGTFVDAPDLTIALTVPTETELLLKGRDYYLRTRVPIRDGDIVVGTVLAEEPFPALTKLKLEADAWGDTGEMGLCTAVGTQQMDCTPIRTHPAAGRYEREVQGRTLPMSRALDQESGVAEMLDYRHRRVLAAYGPVGFTGLGMVIKIDTAELNAPLGQRFGAAVLMLAGLVAAGVLLLRHRLRPLTAALVAAREEATRVASQFKAAAESSLDAYFLMDTVRDDRGAIEDFRIRYVNASGEVLVARPSEDIVGRTLREVLPADQAQFFIARYTRIVSTGESRSEEFRTVGTDAAIAWVAHQAVKLGDGVSVTARDITQLKNVERQLRSKAENDALTGLPNRALFFERLTRALTQARQSGSGVGVLFLDVDRFKRVNDTYGHTVGDAVLVEFAVRLRKLVRRTDTVARLGGDEFAVLLPSLQDVSHAERVAADMLAAVKTPFDAGTIRLHVGTSIGVAFCADGQDTPEALVGRADRSLYNAKASGRGRYSLGTERRAAA